MNNQLTIQNIFNELTKQYNIIEYQNLDLRYFDLVNMKENPRIVNTWQVNKGLNNFILCHVQYSYSYQVVDRIGGHQETDDSDYLFGFIATDIDFGHSYFRPETLMDKLIEFFSPTEIDFKEYKSFSKKFYVLTKDEKKLRSWISKDLVNLFEKTPKIEIEFKDKYCLFKLPKSVDIEETKLLCDFGLKLNKILNQ
ncbi:hypothetical protein [Plebeiibacterium sediminum]|uniref:Uncharacterized protein n=1 Tax=Plebeiibacterium sediminum TaxID=2992112 RepID=A0AAE3M6I8_9BACT|nr:hypothetical protein [Plebeiobacterium sediminum]MCW3788129.1 hypothetical protein [Plebeiobacterium sediminum]